MKCNIIMLLSKVRENLQKSIDSTLNIFTREDACIAEVVNKDLNQFNTMILEQCLENTLKELVMKITEEVEKVGDAENLNEKQKKSLNICFYMILLKKIEEPNDMDHRIKDYIAIVE